MSQSALGLGGERRYSVPSNPLVHDPRGMHSEDLHAWSIYRYPPKITYSGSATRTEASEAAVTRMGVISP